MKLLTKYDGPKIMFLRLQGPAFDRGGGVVTLKGNELWPDLSTDNRHKMEVPRNLPLKMSNKEIMTVAFLR